MTLRAVEKFGRILPVPAGLVAPAGRLGLLIGTGEATNAPQLLSSDWEWRPPILVPQSEGRLVCVADRR